MPVENRPDVTPKDLALAIHGSEGLLFKGPYIGKSGAIIPIYFDLRGLMSFPLTHKKTATNAYLQLVRPLSMRNIADVPVGATSLVSSVCTELSEERKVEIGQITAELEPKDHGSGKGYKGVIRGRRIVVADDTGHTGGSTAEHVNFWKERKWRGKKLEVHDAVALVDYQRGAKERLEALEVSYHYFVTAADVYRYCFQEKVINEDQLKTARKFLEFD